MSPSHGVGDGRCRAYLEADGNVSPARKATAAKKKLSCGADDPAEGGGISLARPKRSWDVVVEF